VPTCHDCLVQPGCEVAVFVLAQQRTCTECEAKFDGCECECWSTLRTETRRCVALEPEASRCSTFAGSSELVSLCGSRLDCDPYFPYLTCTHMPHLSLTSGTTAISLPVQTKSSETTCCTVHKPSPYHNPPSSNPVRATCES